jgi:hypothetical protein
MVSSHANRSVSTDQAGKTVSLRAAALLALVAISGCASDRVHVVPAPLDLGEKNPGKVICVVENPQVAVSLFLQAYRSALQDRGYTVHVVPRNPQASVCPLTTRYVAYQNGFVQLSLYWEGKPAGGATHSAAASSDEAIRALVARLLP